MDLFHVMFLIAFTAILLSIVISKLIALSDCSGDVSSGEEVCAGKDGNLEKKMKVESSKSVKKLTSVKKRVKKASRETVLVSEYKREIEPARHSFDDRKEKFLATEASNACSADQLLSAGKVEDACFGVDFSVECEGLVSKSCGTLNERVVEEVVCPIEGFHQITDSGTELDKLVVYDPRIEDKEDAVIAEELENSNFNYIEQAGSVVHGGRELVHDVVGEELLETSAFNYTEEVGSDVHCDQDLVNFSSETYEETEKTVPEVDYSIDDKNVGYDQMTEHKEDDVVGAELERCSFNHTEEVGNVVHGDQELVNALYPNTYEETEKTVPEIDYRIKEDDVVGEELEICDSNHNEEVGSVDHSDQESVSIVLPSERSKQDEGAERTDPNSDGGIVVGDQEPEPKDGVQDGYVDQADDKNEEIKSSESKEHVVNRDGERRMGNVGLDDEEFTNADLASGTSVGEGFSGQDEGEERSGPKNDDTIDVGLSGGENSVDNDSHEAQRTFEPVELETKDGAQDGHVHQGDDLTGEIRSLVSKDVVNRDEGGISDEAEGKVEISDLEDWEGIESNELEKDFAKALNYFECSNKEGRLSMLGNDVMMQFYGLQKVSMEGPCHEAPPMALKLSARAKWNAWQKLGSMIPEEAMQEYMSLLSEKVPGWLGKHPYVEGEVNSGSRGYSDVGLCTTLTDESEPGKEGVTRAAVNSSSVKTDEQ